MKRKSIICVFLAAVVIPGVNSFSFELDFNGFAKLKKISGDGLFLEIPGYEEALANRNNWLGSGKAFYEGFMKGESIVPNAFKSFRSLYHIDGENLEIRCKRQQEYLRYYSEPDVKMSEYGSSMMRSFEVNMDFVFLFLLKGELDSWDCNTSELKEKIRSWSSTDDYYQKILLNLAWYQFDREDRSLDRRLRSCFGYSDVDLIDPYAWHLDRFFSGEENGLNFLKLHWFLYLSENPHTPIGYFEILPSNIIAGGFERSFYVKEEYARQGYGKKASALIMEQVYQHVKGVEGFETRIDKLNKASIVVSRYSCNRLLARLSGPTDSICMSKRKARFVERQSWRGDLLHLLIFGEETWP